MALDWRVRGQVVVGIVIVVRVLVALDAEVGVRTVGIGTVGLSPLRLLVWVICLIALRGPKAALIGLLNDSPLGITVLDLSDLIVRRISSSFDDGIVVVQRCPGVGELPAFDESGERTGDSCDENFGAKEVSLVFAKDEARAGPVWVLGIVDLENYVERGGGSVEVGVPFGRVVHGVVFWAGTQKRTRNRET